MQSGEGGFDLLLALSVEAGVNSCILSSLPIYAFSQPLISI